LSLLAIVICGAFTLYAIRSRVLVLSSNDLSYRLISRESFLLLGNILLIVSMTSILIGTLYPLMNDALGAPKISVGAPYFNAIFIPFALMAFFMMSLTPSIRFGVSSFREIIFSKNAILFAISFLFASVLTFSAGKNHLFVFLGLFFSIWISLSAFCYFFSQKKNGFALALLLGHLGVAVTCVGITMVANLSEMREVQMKIGESVSLNTYSVLFKGVDSQAGPNYESTVGHFSLFEKGDRFKRNMFPERRYYPARQNMMTDAFIDAGFTRDIYLALGEHIKDDVWAVRLYYKPFIRWIWAGGLLMLLAGLSAAFLRRVRI